MYILQLSELRSSASQPPQFIRLVVNIDLARIFSDGAHGPTFLQVRAYLQQSSLCYEWIFVNKF